MKVTRLVICLATTALASGFVAAPAFAQDDAAPTAAEPIAAQEDQGGVADIVVTAQRRSESLQRVPITIQAFTAEAIQELGVAELRDLEALTPGLNISQTGSDPRPAIRGITTNTNQVDQDPPIGFHIDGVYQPRLIQAATAFFDVERIEVQLGPQGTLYGRNTTGGNIAVITQAPTREFGGYVNAGYGNYDAWQLEGAINLPLSDAVQVRFAAQHREHDFYVRNTTNPANGALAQDSTAGRLSIAFRPSSNFTAILRGAIVRENAPLAGFGPYKAIGIQVDPVTGLSSLTGVIDRSVTTFDPTVPNDPRRGYIPHNDPFSYDHDAEFLSLNMELDLGPVLIRSITGYNHTDAVRSGDFDWSRLDQRFLTYGTDSESYSQELHLASTSDRPFQWILGGFWFQEKGTENFDLEHGPDFPNAAQRGLFITRTTDIDYRSIALFGQASYYVTDNFRLTAGGRYTRDAKDFVSLQQNLNRTVTTLNANLSDTFDRFTWKVGADLFFASGNMLYANYQTGFKSGGFNRTDGSNPLLPISFQPETVRSFELGTRNRFLDGRLQLNASVFHATYNDAHVSQFVGLGLAVTTNAGQIRSHGLNFQAVVVPTEGLRFEFGGELMRARYTRFVNCIPALTGVPTDCSGNRVTNSPEAKLTAAVSYELDLGTAGTLTPRAQLTYTGDYFTTFANTQIDRQSAYTQTDLRLRWEDANDRFHAELFVQNLENNRPLLFTVFDRLPNRVQTAVGYFGEPRTYGMRVGFNF
ncbi:MAG TPA: TonB-dependent receptor [Allosphingosinicella sp.]|nr:TonB-dependent receptor [Allosphingosinicella sp.]